MLRFRFLKLGALAAIVTLGVLPSCGDSRRAEDDDDWRSSEAGEGGKTGGVGRGGRGGSSMEGGEGGLGGEGGGLGGAAGEDGSAASAGSGTAGRGAGGSAGRATGGTGGVAGTTGGDSSAGTAGSAAIGNGGAGGAGSGGAGNGGAGSGGVDAGIVTFLWGDYQESLVDASSYTFSQVSLPPAGPDRLVVIFAHSATNVVASYTSIRIGSVEAQKVASVGEDVQPSAPTAFFVARLPAGDVADIHVDLSATVVRAAIGVCGLYGVGSVTPYDAGSATSMDGAIFPLDVPMGGVVLAALGMADASSADATWADMFELYDTVMVEGTPTHVSGAMRPAAQATETFDVLVSTPSAGYATRGVAVSFR